MPTLDKGKYITRCGLPATVLRTQSASGGWRLFGVVALGNVLFQAFWDLTGGNLTNEQYDLVKRAQ